MGNLHYGHFGDRYLEQQPNGKVNESWDASEVVRLLQPDGDKRLGRC